jgi:hypothetical protein
MRCNAFHPFDCMSVNARNGHVVINFSESRAVEECQVGPTVTKRDTSGCEPR